MKFATIVLAADREGNNPVAKAAGVPCKSLTPLGGKPMLQRVLDALDNCPLVERIIQCGPCEDIWQTHPGLGPVNHPLEWIPPADSPSLSAWNAIESIEQKVPVLLTTADIAFPNPAIFADFCQRAALSGCDVAVGLIPYQKVTDRFPGVRRTPLKFADGPFCTCNMFAFLTPRGREFIRFWRKLEQERKHPWRLIRALGLSPFIRYLWGQLTTADVVQKVQKKLDLKVAFIVLPYPEAAIDVDTEEDLMLARQLINQSGL